jgi:nitrogenase iron protein
MQKLAIYGKGGIGKSTLSVNLSACFGISGRRVLHVGCDPKHDSTLALLDGRQPPTIAELLLTHEDCISDQGQFLATGRFGIDCVEAGGPEPGIGCAGRGIARMFDIFEDVGLFNQNYDLALFDVLGDVVCGGFAGPLREGYADTVVIVLSEELMSMYAANNISRAVVRFQRNGVRMAGLVVNRRDNSIPLTQVEDFAHHLGTKILAVIPRDPLIGEAEMAGKTVVEFAPDSPAAQLFKELAEKIKTIAQDDLHLPTPFTDEQFQQFVRKQRVP